MFTHATVEDKGGEEKCLWFLGQRGNKYISAVKYRAPKRWDVTMQ